MRVIHIYRRLGGVNESDPNREIGFGSVASRAIAPRAARGEAKRCVRVVVFRSLLGPIEAPSGRPPRCRARPPVVSRVVAAVRCFRRLPRKRGNQTLILGGCPGGVRQSKFDSRSPESNFDWRSRESNFESRSRKSNFDSRSRVKVRSGTPSGQPLE